MKPQLILLGAGPGDPELITLKGVKALQNADVILFDALANQELLAHAVKAKVKKYVGKRKNKSSFKQDVINRMIVAYAKRYGSVVRLKGGDPFIFGRGYEELDYARKHGVECKVIPGISSCISLNANFQFPITLRQVSRSFHVFTATNLHGKLSKSVKESIHLEGTKVILMGLSKLPEISKLFVDAGKGNIPVMIVQNGTCDNEKSVLGSMETIVEKAAISGIGTPACIFIGSTVKLSTTNQSYAKKYLISGIS